MKPLDREDWAEAFHEHLKGCSRCRTQPFNLCEEGERIRDSMQRAPLREIRLELTL